MNPSAQLRLYQEAAYKQINTIEFWFRNKYNLSPKDPRVLSTSRDEMLVDYWANILASRYTKLKVDKVDNITLDDLLVEEQLEEELAKAAAEDPNDKGETLIDLHG